MQGSSILVHSKYDLHADLPVIIFIAEDRVRVNVWALGLGPRPAHGKLLAGEPPNFAMMVSI
jgi:hypothetical protein